MSVATILVVEDDTELNDFLRSALDRSGFAVRSVATAADAVAELAIAPIDAVLLDLDLPDLDGLEVLRTINATHHAAVIVLTGRRSESDRVRGLDLGADDYIVKPFSVRELEARIRAVLRRAAPGAASTTVVAGGIAVDLAARTATHAGIVIDLARREFELLAYLATHPHRVFTRHELLVEVWSSSSDWQQEATVTEHVRRLRRKLEVDHGIPRLIHNVRGVGYRFDASRADAGNDAAVS